MGLLSDIYSALDTKKRQIKGLLADPAGTIDMGVRRFREDQQSLLNLFANAYPMAGDKTVLNSPQQIAQFQREAADKAGEMGLAGATVWHGSPHKFDKFDSSKIGTGEGNQAYGHGLYLAESPDVAKGYQANVKDNGKIQNINAELSRLAKIMSADEISYGKYKSDVGKQASKQYSNLMDSRSGVVADPGSIYKVDLPDEHIAKMLDYDNPVPDEMLKPLSAAALKDFGSGATGTSGEKLYKETVFNFKMAGHPNPTQAATDWLTKQGVPGMRYLDGGSRGPSKIYNVGSPRKDFGPYSPYTTLDDAQKQIELLKTHGFTDAEMRIQNQPQTSNFVVFPGNEGLLNILERNGQPVGGLLK